MRVTRLVATSGLAVALVVSGCAAYFDTGEVPEDQRQEIFEFKVEPGSMNPAEAEKAVGDMSPMGRVVPGSALHRGSVEAPGGTVDFIVYRVVDAEMGPEPVLCSSTLAGNTMSSGCGGTETEQARQPVQVQGESSGGQWRTAEFLVQDDVVRVEATAVDGTVYTAIPFNGLGFIEWPDDRGSLELVAYDAAGSELGRAFAGLDG